MRRIDFLRTVVAALLSAIVVRAESAPSGDAQKVAQDFYREVRRERIEGLPNDGQWKRLAPFFAADLQTAFRRAQAEQREAQRKRPDEKPPWIEGDLFSSLFEGPKTWKVGEAKVTGDRAEVPVVLTRPEGHETIRWTDTLQLQRTKKGWQVADIAMGGEWAFQAGGRTLRQTLAPSR